MTNQSVKEAIKEILCDGMIFIPCKSCGETWFVPANFKNISVASFICNKCLTTRAINSSLSERIGGV